MKIKKAKIQNLIDEIDDLLTKIEAFEKTYEQKINEVRPEYKKSAKNLIDYLAIRSVDLSNLQNQLGRIGLSRFARAEGHVLSSLLHSKFILNKLIDQPGDNSGKSGLSSKRGDKILRKNTKILLGYRAKGRRVRIMVTLPTEAAYNYPMVEKFAIAGMNCARINCAAEGPAVWKLMIDNVKKASARIKRKITIIMDLAGPKIRTGKMVDGPRLIKYRPERDDGGNVIHPAEIKLVTEDSTEYSALSLPVSKEWLLKLKEDLKVHLTDNRGRDRILTVKNIDSSKGYAILYCDRTSYISTGTKLFIEGQEDAKNKEKPGIVGMLEAMPGSIVLKPDDLITIHESDEPGEGAKFDQKGHIKEHAHVSCTYPPVFKYVKVDEPVYFDDGKIRGIVTDVRNGEFDVKIIMAGKNGTTLRGDKGINLPDTAIITEGITLKDKEDLKFLSLHSDVVSYSFVNTPQDVEDLFAELRKLNIFNKVGVIIKIETKKAYNNLVPIILTAMKSKNVGIMIARGDLAIEAGWDHMGRIQKEMLTMCSAAHLPVVWATQVLENLTKKGLPSRSEITDAVSALNSECIMLNKGPYIVQSISFLHRVLCNMEAYQHKQQKMLPILEPADAISSK